MRTCLKHLGLAVLALPVLALAPSPGRAQPACDVIVYRDANFRGESWETQNNQSFVGNHWNDQISSIRVVSGVWEFYWDAGYRGEVLKFGPGAYRFVGNHWNDQISSMKCVGGDSAPNEAFLIDGQRYDWYDDGWNGPGFYIIGFQYRRGRGFGGGEGFHGWHHHGAGGHGHGGHHNGGHGHGGGGHHGGGAHHGSGSHHGGGGHGGGHGHAAHHAGGGGHGGGHGGHGHKH